MASPLVSLDSQQYYIRYQEGRRALPGRCTPPLRAKYLLESFTNNCNDGLLLVSNLILLKELNDLVKREDIDICTLMIADGVTIVRKK